MTKLKAVLTATNLHSALRLTVAFIGGALLAYGVARGQIDSETAKKILEFVCDSTGINIPAIVITTIGPLILSVVKNHRVDKTVETALELPAGTSKEELSAVMKAAS